MESAWESFYNHAVLQTRPGIDICPDEMMKSNCFREREMVKMCVCERTSNATRLNVRISNAADAKIALRRIQMFDYVAEYVGSVAAKIARAYGAAWSDK